MARARFDSQLDLLNEQLKGMATATESALMAAVEVLSTRDVDKAREILANDDEIDNFERDIESLCLKLLLMQQPVVAGDLRRVGAALKMVGDLERIGDQASDIADVVLTLDGEFDPELSAHLAAMAGRASAMVHEAVGAYVHRDEERAHAVIGADDGVNEMFNRVKQDVINGIKSEADPAANLVEALMVAKYLERVGDHAQNIAEWVEYSITGLYKGSRSTSQAVGAQPELPALNRGGRCPRNRVAARAPTARPRREPSRGRAAAHSVRPAHPGPARPASARADPESRLNRDFARAL